MTESIPINPRVRGLTRSATLEINERSRALSAEGRDVIRFGFGQSPFPVPEPVVAALRRHAHQKDYLPVSGLPALREAVAAYHRRFNGVEAIPERVVVAPGSKELIYLLQYVVDGQLLLPSPSWVSYAPQAHLLGRPASWVDTTADSGWKVTPEALDTACLRSDRSPAAGPRILVLNYPCNPTGTSFHADELAGIAEVARRHHLVVLADEIYAELHFENKHRSLAEFYPEGTVISAGLSKWCGAGGWRLGTLLIPATLAHLADAMAVVASETYSSTSAPVQHAAITAFEGGPDIEAYLAGCRSVLRSVGEQVVDGLRAAGVAVTEPDGAFYLFPSFEPMADRIRRSGISTGADLCNRLLDETGVALLPGSAFGRPAAEFTARLAYVDFDGAAALARYEHQAATGADSRAGRSGLDPAVLAPRVVEGVARMADWLAALAD